MRLRDLQEQVRTRRQATEADSSIHSVEPEPVVFEKPPPVGLPPEAVPPLTSETEAEAVLWLRAKLTTPQRIGPLIREWAGERDGSTGRYIDDLMAARWALSAQAFIDDDDKCWWRLPHSTLQ